jgi:protein ImuB
METLWLALHLPHLSLGVHPASPSARAVVEQHRIVDCDTAALQMGVRPGMRPALARSLLPDITILPRDTAAEQALLETLACWAGTWTPRICIVPHIGLLLEIGSGLRLFGGFKQLHEDIVTGLCAQGYVAYSVAAPVAQAALWLALSGGDSVRVGELEMRAALDALPLEILVAELPARCITRLSSFGLATLGDVRKLPRPELTRRIGADAVLKIARAYGEHPDARAEFSFPEHFEQKLELLAPVDNAAALIFACRRLVQALSGWLSIRQGGIRECMLILVHRKRKNTYLPLHFAETLRDAERIEIMLRERLPRVALTSPVEALQLKVDTLLDLPGQSRPLFRKEGAQADGMPALIERLRARLGEARVHGYSAIADHRPECVSAPAMQGKDGPVTSSARPLYLLDRPLPLTEHNGRPHSNGSLMLLSGPERIESGWWDEGERNADGRPTGDVRRDYFIALTPEQRWLWIYRECRADFEKGGGWFLHGYFS